jgi:hypothetical protein
VPFSDLPYANGQPGRACPKPSSRLSERIAETKDSKREEQIFRKAVIARDKGLCRCCGIKTVAVLELHSKRREVHHIHGRQGGLRYDVRGALLLCLKDHEKVTRHELRIVGVAKDMFELNGQKYINANSPVTFVRVK